MAEVYIDPTLAASNSEYITFITNLYHQHLISFTDSPLAEAGLFFVRGKDGRIRLIIDCRPGNQRMKPCSKMVMGGSSAWSNVQIPTDATLFTAQYDVEAYFYRIGIPSGLGRLFCLPEVPREVV